MRAYTTTWDQKNKEKPFCVFTSFDEKYPVQHMIEFDDGTELAILAGNDGQSRAAFDKIVNDFHATKEG